MHKLELIALCQRTRPISRVPWAHAHISINLMLIPVNAYLCSAMQKKLCGEKNTLPTHPDNRNIMHSPASTCTHIHTHTYTSIVGDRSWLAVDHFLWLNGHTSIFVFVLLNVTTLVLIGTQLHGRDSHTGSVASWYLTWGWDSHAGTSLFSSWYLASNGGTPTLVIKSGDFDYNFHIRF